MTTTRTDDVPPVTVAATGTARRVEVHGDSALADLLRAALGTATEVPTDTANGAADTATGGHAGGVVVAAGDGGLDVLLAEQAATLDAGRDFLPCRTKGTTVEIGPLVRPGRTGCVACAQARHESVVQVAPMHRALAAEDPRIDIPPHWAALVGALVVDRLAGPLDPAVVTVVALATGEVSQHRISAVPDCAHCDARPDDGPDAGRFGLVARIQPEPGRLRVRPMLPLADLAGLVDHRYGPVTHVYRDPIAPMAFSGAELAVPRRAQRMYAFGRSPDFTDAQRVGLLEAVERESGSLPLSRRTTVYGGYTELADRALDPASLGLPDPAYDHHPASLLDPYSPTATTGWVWAHHFGTGEPVLVPEHVAYYGIGRGPGRARYLYECSNGCAVGGCLEEAILYGCLELVERDAFLLSWYSQTPGTRLSTSTVDDEVSAGMLETLVGEGYETRLYDISGEVGLPVVWALALDPANPTGASLSAAAAHPDPRKAVRGALVEVAAMAVLGNRRGDHPSAATRRAMLADPTRVTGLDEHVALYTLPESLDRLSWLLDGAGPPVEIDERFGDWRQRWIRPDLTASMWLVVDRMRQAGIPPVVVAQTSVRDTGLGVEVVKVIAPGALAMTFGHVHHRTRGLPRLDAARARSGVRGAVLPHPFP